MSVLLAKRREDVLLYYEEMTSIDRSVFALKKHPKFAKLIKKHGPPNLRRGKNIFRALVSSIIYQQVSGKAAASILKKFLKLFRGKKFPTPEDINKMPVLKFRSAGMSSQKAKYIKDLAKKFADGTIKHKKLGKMKNEEIIEHLTQIKGVGVWTVHMLLIFTINRPDILPTGDLGIKKGFQIVFDLKDLPNEEEMEEIARPWREHASLVSWYLWREADLAKSTKNKK